MSRKLDFSVFERTDLQKKVDALVLERVKAGMKLLERKHGADWVDHIDMRSLDLASCSACVLGQVYGDYTVGINNLGIAGIDCSIKYGFERDLESYEELQRTWKAVFSEMDV